MHLVSKMRPVSEGGGRIGIVLNGSPLFTGGAGSGESEIRKYLLEKDLVEAIVALPKDMFYNTGIATYIWLLDNDKPKERKGKVQLIDGSDHYERMRKGIGSKRFALSQENIEELVKLYDGFIETEDSKIFNTEDFGYTTITVERPLRQSWALTPARIEGALDTKAFAKIPLEKVDALKELLFAEAALDIDSTVDLKAFTQRIKTIVEASTVELTAAQVKSFVAAFGERDENAPILEDGKGKPLPDTNLRDSENVPLSQNIDVYVEAEIKPHVADFWLDRSKDKVGYEIPFTRHFYKYVPPRELEEIDADLNKLIAEISTLLREVEQ
jgi:type I restriction enzyme M protein